MNAISCMLKIWIYVDELGKYLRQYFILRFQLYMNTEKDHIRMDEGKDAQQFGMSVFWRPSVSDILFRIHGIQAFFSSVLGNQVNGPGIIQPGIISGPFIIRASDGKGDGPCIPAFFIGP